jgi:hypothetical protein
LFRKLSGNGTSDAFGARIGCLITHLMQITVG